MNGMTRRFAIDFATNPQIVPRAEAKVGDLVEVKLEKVEDTIKETEPIKAVIRHYGKQAKLDLARLKYALSQIDSIIPEFEREIAVAQSRVIAKTEDAQTMLNEMHFGEYSSNAIMEQFSKEEQTEWGLYNAITAVATHSERKSTQTMANYLRKAETILARA